MGFRRRSNRLPTRFFKDVFSSTTFVSAERDGFCVVLTFSGPTSEIDLGSSVNLDIDGCYSENYYDSMTGIGTNAVRVCPLSCEVNVGPENVGEVDGVIRGFDGKPILMPRFSF